MLLMERVQPRVRSKEIWQQRVLLKGLATLFDADPHSFLSITELLQVLLFFWMATN